MDLYFNPLVDLLIKNPGISRDELFIKSGMESNWEFVRQINRLLEEGRISKEYGVYRYSPRVLILVEKHKNEDSSSRIIDLNYLPTEILEEKLNYKKQGIEPEDCIEYDLQIAGYEIKKENKAFLEAYNNICLNVDEFRYFLWAKYLFKRLEISEDYSVF